jgi:hypothetical protein
MGNMPAGCNFSCNGDNNSKGGVSEQQASEEVCLMRAEMPIARAYAPPEGEIAEDTPANILLTGDCGNNYYPELEQIINSTKGQEQKIKENSSTPTQEVEMAGGTGGEPITNGSNNLFEDIPTAVVLSSVVTKKPSLN